ncbi:MAG: C4-type zinc ribbon domain-containing protein [Phycisphaeraceae bacterium]
MSLHEKLRQLFLLDQQVRGLRMRLDAAEKSLGIQQTRLARLQQQRQELADQHKQIKTKASVLEHQTRDMDEHANRLREQMNSVRNNKEYSALLLEVNTIKLEKGKIEDQALEQMGEADKLDVQVKEIEAKVAEQEKLMAGSAAEVERAKAEVGERLTEANHQREAAAGQVPDDARTIYDRLAHVYEGEAMAAVVEESKRHREYSCGGCYLSIPVERVNALLVRDEVVCCPGCGRMLYLDEILKASSKVAADKRG